MVTILQIFGSACLAILIADASGMIQWLKYKLNMQSLKPLDCPLCLAWWVALILFLAKGDFLNAPLFAATSSIIAILLSKLLRY